MKQLVDQEKNKQQIEEEIGVEIKPILDKKNSKLVDEEIILMSDNIRIANTTWANLKQVAMGGNNEQQSWFVSTFEC